MTSNERPVLNVRSSPGSESVSHWIGRSAYRFRAAARMPVDGSTATTSYPSDAGHSASRPLPEPYGFVAVRERIGARVVPGGRVGQCVFSPTGLDFRGLSKKCSQFIEHGTRNGYWIVSLRPDVRRAGARVGLAFDRHRGLELHLCALHRIPSVAVGR